MQRAAEPRWHDACFRAAPCSSIERTAAAAGWRPPTRSLGEPARRWRSPRSWRRCPRVAPPTVPPSPTPARARRVHPTSSASRSCTATVSIVASPGRSPARRGIRAAQALPARPTATSGSAARASMPACSRASARWPPAPTRSLARSSAGGLDSVASENLSRASSGRGAATSAVRARQSPSLRRRDEAGLGHPLRASDAGAAWRSGGPGGESADRRSRPASCRSRPRRAAAVGRRARSARGRGSGPGRQGSPPR